MLTIMHSAKITRELTNSVMVMALRPPRTVRPQLLDIIQKPESLTWPMDIPPAQAAMVMNSGLKPMAATDAAMMEQDVVQATVAEPCATRSTRATR